MALTSHQQEKLQEALSKLKQQGRLKSNGRAIINGNAGTGKTYLCKALVEELLIAIPYGKIICSAPTNEAVGVLQDKVNIKTARLTFSTVASVLNIRMRIDNKLHKKVFEPMINPQYPPLRGVKLWIIDEASMIGEKVLEWIEEHATKQQCTVIFVGDDKQINPVGEEDSPVFLTNYPVISLTEPVRQDSDNPIIPLSMNLKAIWLGDTILNDKGHGFVYTYDRPKIIMELGAVNGTDDLKYLAWTNDEVNAINRDVRHFVYGENPAKIELNETLIFEEPYGDDYITRERIKVNTVDIATITYNIMVTNQSAERFSLKVYVINGTKREVTWPEYKVTYTGVFVIHEDSEAEYNRILHILKTNVRYKQLRYSYQCDFEDMFAKLGYNHAITVHKSQGSTYRRTILNVSNIMRNSSQKEKDRLLYTGSTRAKELLILYNV